MPSMFGDLRVGLYRGVLEDGRVVEVSSLLYQNVVDPSAFSPEWWADKLETSYSDFFGDIVLYRGACVVCRRGGTYTCAYCDSFLCSGCCDRHGRFCYGYREWLQGQ